MAKGEEKTYDEREREREKHDRRQSEELKEVMKIRRSRKGAYDKRMRRSTRNTTTLILDLVTLTPAAMCPSPPITSVYAHLRAAHRRFNSPRFAPTRLRSLCFPLATYICCSPHCLANCFHCLLSSDIRLMQYVRAFPIPERSLDKRKKDEPNFSLSMETRLGSRFPFVGIRAN